MSFRLSTLSLVTGAVIACLHAPAFAAEQQGWYLGAGAGYAKTTVSNIPIPSFISQKTNDTGFKLYGGYQFNSYLATEIEVVSLGKYTMNYGDIHASVSTKGLGFSAIGKLPLSDQFSLFGKLGVVNKHIKTQAHYYTEFDTEKKVVTSALLGGGAEYYFTPNLALRAEYEHFGKSGISEDNIKVSSNLISLSMHYRF